MRANMLPYASIVDDTFGDTLFGTKPSPGATYREKDGMQAVDAAPTVAADGTQILNEPARRPAARKSREYAVSPPPPLSGFAVVVASTSLVLTTAVAFVNVVATIVAAVVPAVVAFGAHRRASSLRGGRSRPPLRGILAWLVLAVPAVGAQTPLQQKKALEALYNATNGAGWSGGGNTNWLSGDPCTPADNHSGGGHWAGVVCSGGDVTQLYARAPPPNPPQPSSSSPPSDPINRVVAPRSYLNQNNLVGTLPTEVAGLSSLTDLCASYHTSPRTSPYLRITPPARPQGRLPSSQPSDPINRLVAPRSALYQNSISGSLPTEVAGLTSLNYLCASYHTSPRTSPYLRITPPARPQSRLPSSSPPSDPINRLVAPRSDLDSNSISGSLPSQIGRLTGLGQDQGGLCVSFELSLHLFPYRTQP